MMGNSMPNRVHKGVCSMMLLPEKRCRECDDVLRQTGFQQNGHLTPGIRRGEQRERGTSGRCLPSPGCLALGADSGRSNTFCGFHSAGEEGAFQLSPTC